MILVKHRCSRPYRLENTGSRPITAVKQDWIGVSTWMEDRLGILRVVSFVFSPVIVLIFCETSK